MQRTAFQSIDCSIARTMAIFGEPWAPLILRDLFIGITRFDQLHTHLGVSRKVLTLRLNKLVANGVAVKQLYSDRPARSDYILTDKGWELCDVLLAVSAWGDRWTAGTAGPPASLRHRRCGHVIAAQIRCSHCHEELRAHDVDVTPLR